MQFNHFHIRDEEPLLFHAGLRAMFPLRKAVARRMDPAKLRYVAGRRFESDESGAPQLGRYWDTYTRQLLHHCKERLAWRSRWSFSLGGWSCWSPAQHRLCGALHGFATLLGVTPIVGLTIVSIGTSTPELAVGIIASLQGKGGLAVGTVAAIGAIAAFVTGKQVCRLEGGLGVGIYLPYLACSCYFVLEPGASFRPNAQWT